VPINDDPATDNDGTPHYPRLHDRGAGNNAATHHLARYNAATILISFEPEIHRLVYRRI
jgi:hypothetical protein